MKNRKTFLSLRLCDFAGNTSPAKSQSCKGKQKFLGIRVQVSVCDGKVSLCDAQVDICDGTVSLCDAQVDVCDGKVSICDAQVSLCDVQVSLCDGQVDVCDEQVGTCFVRVDTCFDFYSPGIETIRKRVQNSVGLHSIFNAQIARES